MGVDLYERREQTFVKHEALRAYLERFAHIVGYSFGTLVYVDGFAGPWRVRSETLDDSSFAIAIRELRKARKDLAEIGDEVKSKLEIIPASRMDDVLKVALQRMPTPITVEEEAAAIAAAAASVNEQSRVTAH